MRFLRSGGWWLVGPALALLATAQPRLEAQGGGSAAARARTIASALAKLRVAAGLREAEEAVATHPDSGLLQLRLAQAQVCAALDADERLGRTVDDLGLHQALQRGLSRLREGGQGPLDGKPGAVEAARKTIEANAREILSEETLQAADLFQARVRRQVAESGPLVERRSVLLADSLRTLKRARKLGEVSTELALTELWVRAICLLWRAEQPVVSERLAALAAGRPIEGLDALAAGLSPSSLDKALGEAARNTPPAVLKAALDLAASRKDDPPAIAGAADILSIVAGIQGARDPLHQYIQTRLNGRYLDRQTQLRAGQENGAEAARRLYEQATGTAEVDDAKLPTVAAIRLYERALVLDKDGKLPYLRVRLFLLRAAFDPDRAGALLEDLARREPRNAVVPLERARTALRLEEDLPRAVAHCRDAARLADFRRSYLVSVPEPLRPALKFHRGVRELVKRGWPDYSGLFTALREVQTAAPTREVRHEFRMLRLHLADRLCGADDYPDQAFGIHQKAGVLDELSSGREPLPPEQRLRVEVLRRGHERAYASFPRQHDWIELRGEGIEFRSFPALGSSGSQKKGPQMSISANGTLVMGLKFSGP